MTVDQFQPAGTLDEANQRLRKLEHALAVERDRVRRMTPSATFEEEEQVRREIESGTWVPARPAFDTIIAELRAARG